MKIKFLQLENYRCFEHFKITFNEQLTILVGMNGAGKTTVLDGLSLFLESIVNTVAMNPLYGKDPEECRASLKSPDTKDAFINQNTALELSDFKRISYKVQLSDLLDKYEPNCNSVKMSFEQDQLSPERYALCDLEKSPAQIWKLIKYIGKAKKEKGLPIFAYYRSARLTGKTMENPLDAQMMNRYPHSDAFLNAFSPLIDFEASLKWFEKMDALEARQARDTGDIYFSLPELEAIREAISLNLGDYEKPRIGGTPPQLLVQRKGVEQYYTIDQLSDGYGTMLALIMDLARRMAKANGDSEKFKTESVLKSEAVVLIDEVDLHLHPSWQQTVLPSLLQTFPNTQFIVTTHSPQVLSSIAGKHIQVLENGTLLEREFEESEGADASRLLKRVFGVDPRLRSLDIVKDLEELSRLLSTDEWDSPKAHELLKNLENHFGNSDPEVNLLKMIRDNKIWERENGL